MTKELNGWGAINTDDNTGGTGSGDRPDFMKISLGDHKVRILDPMPHAYQERWAQRGNGGTGTSIPYLGSDDLLESENRAFMSKIFKEADEKKLKDKARKDFLKNEGYAKQPHGKVKKKFIIHVLDRASGEVKLLDKGSAIFGKIQALALNAEYGDPREYDITITMKDTKGKGNFQDIEYDVTPARSNTPLTEAEVALYEAKKVDLAKLKAPKYTPEQYLALAKGATYDDLEGNKPEANDPELVKDDAPAEKPEEVKEEAKPEKDEDVKVDKAGALTEEELSKLSFD